MSKDKNIKLTPLMRQYRQIKDKYPDTIMLFRVGDFYETFEDDAKITSSVLGITLTKRANGAASEVPLAGFPFHALDTYLPKLVKAGYRVAVCDQLEDPKFARGIVKRDVTEVVTPGVTLNDKLLENKKNNYLAAIYIKDNFAGFAFSDISTGEFYTSEILLSELKEQIENISPTEILYPKRDKEILFKIISSLNIEKPVLTKIDDWVFSFDFGYEILIKHFKTNSLKGFGIENMKLAIVAAGAVLNYFLDTQKSNLGHIKKISKYDHSDFIILDPSTKRNLEIISSLIDGNREGTLLSILDKTRTPMGGRLFKKWISRPLKNLDLINKRAEAVEELFVKKDIREKIAYELSEIGDIERLISKICTGRAVARDVVNLKVILKKIPNLRAIISTLNTSTIEKVFHNLDPLQVVVGKIESALDEESLSPGGSGERIKKGYSTDLDELRKIASEAKSWIANQQQYERQRTGINSLKIEYNSVFGYYIEVSKANLSKVPDNYIRKQTLVNAERFITPELKQYEEKVLNAEEKIKVLEDELFNQLKQFISEHAESIQKNAHLIALLDCLVSLAEVAHENNYVRPIVNNSDEIEIIEGRHPVIEKFLPIGVPFIPNDVYLSNNENQILIITGPNMAGKSVFLRQVGLIVLLAQIGSFVPAKKATIGLVDKIFTRVGASDNIASGESTFLVEMNETANILNNATPKSLILLDEVGRGTSTFDGVSIAWAITEYLHENKKVAAKTLFATHYHELNELARIFPRIKNYKVEVKEIDDKVIFLHKVTPGFADHSYGIQVAKMAGLPEEVTERAKEILKNLEESELRIYEDEEKDSTKAVKDISMKKIIPNLFQINLFEMNDSKIREELNKVDVNNLTPMQALQKLNELKEALKDGTS
ncbi:MAG TPA: DNA mismatch repair protein MutS [Ignavibacteria bacterium]